MIPTPQLVKAPTRIVVPPWMPIAFAEIGINERDDPDRVRYYHGHTRGGEALATVPWCSSGLCYVFEMAGIESTQSKAASSWLTWGDELSDLRFGCVLVFGQMTQDAGGTGHCGLYMGGDRKRVACLGFNQSDEVSVKWYPRIHLRSKRWPRGVDLTSP